MAGGTCSLTEHLQLVQHFSLVASQLSQQNLQPGGVPGQSFGWHGLQGRQALQASGYAAAAVCGSQAQPVRLP